MSRPRAATSVATRTRISPDLKLLEGARPLGLASGRCGSRPRRGPAGRATSRAGSPPIFVRVKTSTWRRSCFADQVGQQLLLAVAIDRVDELADRLDRRVARRDLDLDRVVRRIVRDRRRISSEKVAENIRFWRLRREQGDDPLDVGQEAHVEHPVGLVEDEDLDLAEVRDPLADEVEQPAGRRDEDLDARRGAP